MGLFSRYIDEEELSPEEQSLYAQLKQQSSNKNSLNVAGQIGGAVLGGIGSLASGGALSIPAIMAGSQMGQAAASVAGNLFDQSAELENRITEAKKRRLEPQIAKNRRLSAVGELLGSYLPRGF